jgi:uncharacterized membrane protein
MKKIFNLFFIFWLLLLTSCYYDKAELVYPAVNTCDTANITFTTHVKPIINANCVSCHSASQPAAGYNLSTYAGIQPIAANGLLNKVINHTAGVSPMPKNTSKLSTCNIAKIRTWIRNGALNN